MEGDQKGLRFVSSMVLGIAEALEQELMIEKEATVQIRSARRALRRIEDAMRASAKKG